MCFRVNPKSTLFQRWICSMNQRWQIDAESTWISRRDVISTYINVESTLSVCWVLPVYLFTKPSFQSPLAPPFSIPQQFFTYPFFRAIIPTIYSKSSFSTSTIYPIQAVSRDLCARASCEDWHCFTLSLIPRSVDREHRAHNYLILISQAQKNWCIAGSL